MHNNSHSSICFNLPEQERGREDVARAAIQNIDITLHSVKPPLEYFNLLFSVTLFLWLLKNLIYCLPGKISVTYIQGILIVFCNPFTYLNISFSHLIIIIVHTFLLLCNHQQNYRCGGGFHVLKSIFIK